MRIAKRADPRRLAVLKVQIHDETYVAEALAKIEALERQAEVAPNSINLRMNEGAVAIMNRALKAWGKQSQLEGKNQDHQNASPPCRHGVGHGREIGDYPVNRLAYLCRELYAYQQPDHSSDN